MTDAGGLVDVVYLPYLPLRDRAAVGSWELIPAADLRETDCQDNRACELARGLGEVYVLPRNRQTAAGAFARPHDGRVGDDARDLSQFDDLRRSCLVSVLDPNPSPLVSEEQRDLNAGHWMLTAENATVVGHGIDRNGYTGTSTGSRYPFLSIGTSVLDQPERPNGRRGQVLPPADVRIPTFGARPFDAQLADATWQTMRRGDDHARRLGRAIDWLGLSALNTTALSDDVRVPSLRAGLEVLLGTDDFLRLGAGLAQLIDDTSQPSARTWTSLSGASRTEALGDVAWWCVRFSFLRNKLMHGDVLERADWVHEDAAHVDLGDWFLRQAIKHTVAADGHADVLTDLPWRAAWAALRPTRDSANPA